MKFIPLVSSSAGNAYLLDDGCSRILIECGVTFKRLQQLCGFSMASIDGCLISHEHKDHSHCAAQIIKAGIPTYMSNGTAAELLEKGSLTGPLVETANEMVAWEQFQIGSFKVLPFPTFHDCAEPLGFCIQSAADGDVFAFAIDTVNIPYRFPGVNILAVECNYDPKKFYWLDDVIADDDSLDSIKKRQLRKRIKRTINTHMSIDTLVKCLNRMDLSKCREIWLMHLSDDNSREYDFIQKVKRTAPKQTIVRVCPK